MATRYHNPPSVHTEIVAFDRSGGFAPGEYWLSQIAPVEKLGARAKHARGRKTGTRPRSRHITTGIRRFA